MERQSNECRFGLKANGSDDLERVGKDTETMSEANREWAQAKEELIYNVTSLGFPESIGEEMAKNLGSPKAMRRMSAYLRYEKPKKVEVAVDEMLAICSEIDAWRDRKESLEANAKYNELKYFGLE